MSVAIGLIRSVADELERGRHDSKAVLRRAGIAPALLDDPLARIEEEPYERVQRLAVEVSGDPAFGLHMGERSSVGSFTLLGHLATQCRTMRDAVNVILRYYRLLADTKPPQLIEQGDEAQLLYPTVPTDDPVVTRVRVEFSLVRILAIMRLFTGPDSLPTEAWLRYPAPSYVGEYDRIFGGRARFNRPWDGFVVPLSLLDATQLYHDPRLFDVLQQQAEDLLRHLEDRDGIAGRVRYLITHGPFEGRPDMETIARRLGMSARSLRRRLSAEGGSFADVVDDALGDLAQRLLSERRMSIQETAYRLGFSDASSFHRAFKRWTGQTPGEFRKESEPPPPMAAGEGEPTDSR